MIMLLRKSSQLVKGNLFFLQGQLPGFVLSLARELDPFFWMKWTVLGLRPDLWTVTATHLVFITVSTLKMLESLVKVYVGKLDLLCPRAFNVLYSQ